jgi:type IV pilus assembly protein PilB
MDMGISGHGIASTLNCMVFCRTVRRNCPACRQKRSATPIEAEFLGMETFVLEGKGCPACQNTGFMGRAGIYEVMSIDDNMRRKIMHIFQQKEVELPQNHNRSFLARGKEKILQGETTVNELLSV